MFGRSKERSFLFLILSMAVVAFVLFNGPALFGLSNIRSIICIALLLCQGAIVLWLFKAEDDQSAARIGEAVAAAPFGLALLLTMVH